MAFGPYAVAFHASTKDDAVTGLRSGNVQPGSRPTRPRGRRACHAGRTDDAVTGLPSWNVQPGCSRTVQVVLSADTIDSATPLYSTRPPAGGSPSPGHRDLAT